VEVTVFPYLCKDIFKPWLARHFEVTEVCCLVGCDASNLADFYFHFGGTFLSFPSTLSLFQFVDHAILLFDATELLVALSDKLNIL
jgi:hypothetical protein